MSSTVVWPIRATTTDLPRHAALAPAPRPVWANDTESGGPNADHPRIARAYGHSGHRVRQVVRCRFKLGHPCGVSVRIRLQARVV